MQETEPLKTLRFPYQIYAISSSPNFIIISIGGDFNQTNSKLVSSLIRCLKIIVCIWK